MNLTKDQLTNLKELSNTLQILMSNPNPENKAWQAKLRIAIKSISEYSS